MTSCKIKNWSLSVWPVCGLVVLLMLTGCSTGLGSPSSTPAVVSQPTQQSGSPAVVSQPTQQSGSPAVVSQPTQGTARGPSPVATLLAAAPKDCPAGPALASKVFPQFGSPAIGGGPVWEFGLAPNSILNLNDQGYTAWPSTKILWPVGSGFPNAVTVRVTNLKTGAEAWWDIGEGAPPPSKPVRPLILGPQGNRAGGPPTFGAALYLSQAGCYAMTVSWSGRQWRLLFAVGR